MSYPFLPTPTWVLPVLVDPKFAGMERGSRRFVFDDEP